MRIFVTGSSGFIGTHLVKELSKDHELIVPPKRQLNILDSIKLEEKIRDEKPDLICHLANPRDYNLLPSLSETIIMMRNILEASRMNDVSILFLSSLGIFPWPIDPYSQSKYLCEKLCEVYNGIYQLKIQILRPSYVYGSGMHSDKIVMKFIKKALVSEPIYLHKYKNGFPRFDFINVLDLVTGIKKSIEKGNMPPLNIGTGISTSVMELAKLIVDLTKSTSELRIQEINDFAQNYIIDPLNSYQVLDWKPKLSLQVGLRDLIGVLKNEN